MPNISVEGWALLIAAVGVVIVNSINAWRLTGKVDTVVQTAKIIEGHVNSATTKADERAQAGVAREAALQATIDELRKAASLLAQAAAIKSAGAQSGQPKV